MPDTLRKQPSENVLYDMEFSAILDTGETISSITSTTIYDDGVASSDITVHSSVASGTKAQVRLSGGVDGTTYKVTVIVLTSASNTREGDGYLAVINL